MKLAKPPAYSDDARYETERRTYLAHCENIAAILAAAFKSKPNARQELIDQYLEAVDTETEE
jgi:hypothetical protein